MRERPRLFASFAVALAFAGCNGGAPSVLVKTDAALNLGLLVRRDTERIRSIV